MIQANLLCLEKQLRKGEVFNIAVGRPVTINELTGVINRKMGKSRIKPMHKPLERARRNPLRFFIAGPRWV